jgi:membrane associated rhomboid family serine protease
MSFENASFTKGLVLVCALTSIFAGIFDVKHYFHLQFVPHISRHHQYWRLFTHHLAFLNSSDLFVAELLFYNVGVQIERQFGSLKYASFAFVSTFMATLLELISLILFHRAGLNHISVGPSALIFSVIYQYSRIVPAVYNFRIFGLPLNNKSVNYLLALQLAMSRLPGSAAVAIIGIITGQIYRSDIAGFNTYRLPPSIVRFSTRFILPLIGSLRAPRRTNRALPDETSSAGTTTEASPHNEEVISTARSPRPGATSRTHDNANSESVMREWVNELTGRVDRANAGLRVPADTEITHITSMFPSMEREVVVGALQRSPNIETAVETLLISQI